MCNILVTNVSLKVQKVIHLMHTKQTIIKRDIACEHCMFMTTSGEVTETHISDIHKEKGKKDAEVKEPDNVRSVEEQDIQVATTNGENAKNDIRCEKCNFEATSEEEKLDHMIATHPLQPIRW